MGVDFAGKRGSPIRSVAAGIVLFSGTRSGLGRVVEIDHGKGYVTRYAHNLKNLVKAGERVAKGQQIAMMGSSGRSTGNHVHFEVLRDGKPLDPMSYIRRRPQEFLRYAPRGTGRRHRPELRMLRVGSKRLRRLLH